MVPLEKFDKSPVAASSQCVTQISVEYAQYTMIDHTSTNLVALY